MSSLQSQQEDKSQWESLKVSSQTQTRVLSTTCTRVRKHATEVKEGVTLTPEISVTNAVLSLSFSQQIQFTLIVNVVNLK